MKVSAQHPLPSLHPELGLWELTVSFLLLVNTSLALVVATSKPDIGVWLVGYLFSSLGYIVSNLVVPNYLTNTGTIEMEPIHSYNVHSNFCCLAVHQVLDSVSDDP